MNKGDVLFWSKYPFIDRDAPYGYAPSDKLLVVMGTGHNGDFLLFRTTSQPRIDRPDPDGCHSDSSVYRFKSHLAQFKKPTWVLFEQFFIHDEREILNAGARVIFTLASNDIQAILNCFKRSPELSNWLLEYCA